ncbi:MAG: hypothetical protein DI538_10145 [Azospira oryzae]|jgi:hypothetical protein|nr:MAG: hypothetical protein DI538_10145 [Azospira oryzae]
MMVLINYEILINYEMDIQTILGYTLPLVGVLLGGIIGLFSPLISNVLDKNKRKRDLKHDLLKSVYIFFSIRKEHYRVSGTLSFLINRDEVYRTEIRSSSDPKKIKELEWVVETDRETTAHHTEKAESLFLEIMKIEAELIVLSNEVKFYYNHNKYLFVQPIIKSIIDDSNNPESYTFNFETSSVTAFDADQRPFEKRMQKHFQKLQNDCDVIIESISKNI